MQNWFDHIMFHTRVQPEKPAIVMEDRVVTYGMLNIGIERCVQRLASLIIPSPEPVAVLVTNSIRHITLCLALFRAGIPSISLTSGQIAIANTKFAAVLSDKKATTTFSSGHHVIPVGDDWFATDPVSADNFSGGFLDQKQICRMCLTSGTTGEPKVVKQSVEDIGRRAQNLLLFNWNRLLCLPGLSTTFGFWSACAALVAGRTLCFSKSPFQAIRIIDLFSIDYVMAATEQLLALTRVARKTGAQLHSLGTVEIGGSIATTALLESAMIHLCRDIKCFYGASEAGPMARAHARDVLSRPGLVGHVLPGVEITVVDHNNNPRPHREIGLVRSRLDPRWDAMSPGASTGKEGWIDLGDLGWMTETGELYILGRVADTAVNKTLQGPAAAQQIYPVYEIEHLLRLEWDASDAAAVLVCDGTGPPQIWIGTVDCNDASAEKLEAIMRSKGIEGSVRLFSIKYVPRGANGKVQRAELKRMLAYRSA